MAKIHPAISPLGTGEVSQAVRQPGVSSPKSVKTGQFEQILLQKRGEKSAPNRNEAIERLSGFFSEWRDVHAKTVKSLDRLPKEAKEMMELQIAVNRLHLRTTLATKAGETFSSTLRRVQQMGSS